MFVITYFAAFICANRVSDLGFAGKRQLYHCPQASSHLQPKETSTTTGQPLTESSRISHKMLIFSSIRSFLLVLLATGSPRPTLAGRDTKGSNYTWSAAASSQTLCQIATRPHQFSRPLIPSTDCVDLMTNNVMTGIWTVNLATAQRGLTIASSGTCEISIAMKSEDDAIVQLKYVPLKIIFCAVPSECHTHPS